MVTNLDEEVKIKHKILHQMAVLNVELEKCNFYKTSPHSSIEKVHSQKRASFRLCKA